MKWRKDDVSKYITAKEYIDTMVIPIIPFQMSVDSAMEKDAFQNEVISAFSAELEKELAGRVMLGPSYYYVKGVDQESEIQRINTWMDEIQKQPFEHTFFLTVDPTWKKNEQALQGTLIWLTGMQSGDLNSSEMQTQIRGQADQISELIRSYWI